MRGELAFEPALRERVGLLRGLPVAVVDRIIAERITLTPGGAALVRDHEGAGRLRGARLGRLHLFTGPVAAMIGFDEHRSNVLLAKGGELLGAVEEPILGKEAKLATLDRAARPLRPAARGDDGRRRRRERPRHAAGKPASASPIRAKPAVAAAAHARIDHGDLTALLYIQGYRREEFAG